ncbi:LysM peptidoglycan-binding domain-containing protein [Permianibacter sp. IMCC34836]|uniref:LysM peptidoglycan-binding domain-containing protein n=1 Tax=Permianibacter fluminis TaxID=2738515 RepID=UPI0015576A0F|nr:LysM domain-containing protein [Permianibacter fluminis]NQD36069.1 LysM peptidoglycan-binding domain-containing protein [Permianibacter fluminis]
MNKIVVGLAAFTLSAASSLALALELAPNPPEVYVVVKGDTLWDISSRYLSDPWSWPEIWQANPQIENPHLIYPGDVLSLVYVDGKPRVQRTAGPGTAMPSSGNSDVIETRMADGTTRLSPRARVLSEGDAIPTLPLELIAPFLTDARVIDDESLKNAAYVLANDSEHVVGGQGNNVYVRGVNTGLEEKSYTIFRPGAAYIDPVTEETLGFEAIHVADAAMIREGDPATFQLRKSPQEVRAGDRALPVEKSYLAPNFFPTPAPETLQPQIISVYGGVTQIGQYNIVVLNKGAREGVKNGHTFTVWAAGKFIKDDIGADRAQSDENKSFFSKVKDFFSGGPGSQAVKLPDETAGHLMVFRTFDKVSLALVMDASRAIHVGDIAKTPN